MRGAARGPATTLELGMHSLVHPLTPTLAALHAAPKSQEMCTAIAHRFFITYGTNPFSGLLMSQLLT